ncbi:hypothetical protein G6F43_000558 [Rhizopus delemar]|nr:hypothetical protein G6F43_000558 [Rhizopus delemar]
MKYGLELQQNMFAPWRHSYVSYDTLKHELKNRQLDNGWTTKDEEKFVSLLDNELNKVYDFINAKSLEIDSRVLYCERTMKTFQKSLDASIDANYKIMDDTLTEILFDINDLSQFTRVNYVAIQKILKKHDKWTGLQLKQTFVEKLREKPLDKQRFDETIVYISALHHICRNLGKQFPVDTSFSSDQNKPKRTTVTYWVHPDNITEVKALVMLHLPIFIRDKQKLCELESSTISSVYFDNSSLDLYNTCLQRDEGAEAIRFRWYGSMSESEIYIERKTQSASWPNDNSAKDSFQLEKDQITAFMLGSLTADEIVKDINQSKLDKSSPDQTRFIAQDIQKSFREKKLQPMVRTFCNRTSFQLPEDHRLRISLDTDVTFIREDHMDNLIRRQSSPSWRRSDVDVDYPFDKIQEQDVLRFPYAVLKMKLQTDSNQWPEWLSALIECHLIHEVPRFSKYLHAASCFYREKLILLPSWLSELDVDIRKPKRKNRGLVRPENVKPLIDGKYKACKPRKKDKEHNPTKKTPDLSSGPATAVNNTSPTPTVTANITKQQKKLALGLPAKKKDIKEPSSSTENLTFLDKCFAKRNQDIELGRVESKVKKAKLKVRAEPKVFFANERTFISWLQFCALLLTVALNLFNFGDVVSRIIGGIFITLAASISIYALYRFEKRAWMINRRIEGRYDDIWGPVVLCALLVIALIVNFYLRFK